MYHFDEVFLPETSQAKMFTEVQPFVQAGLNGDNVCIFAYGQTGSGKTYTMEGCTLILHDNQLQEASGILPRTAVFVQSEVQRLKQQLGKDMRVEISALEVYCDQIFDIFESKQKSTK